MKITEELVSRTARLARLDLPEGEVCAMTAELERILADMDALASLDVAGVEPMYHVVPLENVLRPDQVLPSWDRGELLAGAPDADGVFFLAPQTVEQGECT